MELIVRNAQLHNGPLVDIGIDGGKITAIEPHLPTSSQNEIDAGRAADNPRVCQRPVTRLQILLAATADPTAAGGAGVATLPGRGPRQTALHRR